MQNQPHKAITAHLFSLFGKDLNPQAIALYADAMKGVSAEEFGGAVKQFLRESKQFRLPAPGELLAISGHSEAPSSQIARVLAEKVYALIASKGYTFASGFFRADSEQPVFELGGKDYSSLHEALESALGPIGLKAITESGGYLRLLESINEQPKGVVISQLTAHIDSLIQLSKAGVQVEELPMPEPKALVGVAKDVLEKLDSKQVQRLS